MRSGIYSITNIVNGKKIIGQAVDIGNRWRGHRYMLRNNRHHNPHLQNAWNKYGEQNFKFEVILECSTDTLSNEEVRLIKAYDTTNREMGYNLTSGGERPTHSEETKKKMSEARLRNPIRAMMGRHHTEETKKKIGDINRGANSACYGKRHSEATRQKMSESNARYNLGKHFSEETILKMRNAHLGKHLSENAKQKIRDHYARKHMVASVT